MKIRSKVVEIYNNEVNGLIESLRYMSKEDRFRLYGSHSKMLFPRSKEVINLEDQLSGRSDYIHKFKKSFFIIGNMFFSTNYFGEYNQEYFIDKTGFKSQRYPQKVILALSMTGYITGMRCKNSVGHHGYIYNVNYWKYKGWGDDFFGNGLNSGIQSDYVDDLMDIHLEDEEEKTCLKPDFGDDWLWEKQIETIKSIEVDEAVFCSLMKEKDGYLTCANANNQDNELSLHISRNL